MIFRFTCQRLLDNSGFRSHIRNECLNLFSTSRISNAIGTEISTFGSGGSRLPPGYNAPTAFALYVQEQIKGTSGRVNQSIKTVSVNWNNLDGKSKQQYVDNSKKLASELKSKFELLPDEQKQDLYLQHADKLTKRSRIRKKRELHKFREETNRPKQPISSFMLFVKELYGKIAQKLDTKEQLVQFMASTGEKWRNMSDDEKKIYVEQAEQNKMKYRAELIEWKTENAGVIAEWNAVHAPKVKKVVVREKTTAKKAKTGKKVTASARQKAKKTATDAKKATAKTPKPKQKEKEQKVGQVEKEKPKSKKVKKAEVQGAID